MQKLVFINNNGNEIDLTSGNFGITNWSGLSNTDLNIQTQKVPFEDGSVFLDALIEQRDIEVTVAIYDGNDLEVRYQKKRELISALNPKLGEGTLIYTNDFLSKQIKAVPQIPLFMNKNSNDAGTLKASVSFICPSPYWEDLQETSVEFIMGQSPTIINEGDVPTQLEIEFLTIGVENPKLIDVNNDRKIEYTGLLNKNLYINTNFGQKKVVTKDLMFGLSRFKGNNFDVCFSNFLGMFIGVSEGIIFKSYDAITWTQHKSGVNATLYSVTYSEELKLFAAVGDKGVIITSPDGITWTQHASGINSILWSVIYSDELNLFVTVGNNGEILTSPDGINWTQQSSGGNAQLKSVIYCEELSLFVIVGGSTILTSPDGINWTPQTVSVTAIFESICYSNELNLFVIVGMGVPSFDAVILTSSDATTWTIQSSGITKYGLSIVYSEDLKLFVMGGKEGTIYTSSDGINWTEQSTGLSYADNINSIIYSSVTSLFVAVSDNGVIITSPDGITWTIQSEANNFNLLSVAYSNKLKMFAGVSVNKILTSPDGITWTEQNVPRISFPLTSIIYTEKLNQFMVIGERGFVFVSEDGINWTEQSNVRGSDLYSVIFCNDLNIYVVVGKEAGGNFGRVSTSPDGINWTQQPITSSSLNSIAYASDLHLFATVSSNGNIYTSPDATTWTQRYSIGLVSKLSSVVYSEKLNMFVVVGNAGRILTSTDGITWTQQSSGLLSADILNSVTYSEELSLFIAVGNNSTIITSIDGENWVISGQDFLSTFYAVTYSEMLNLFLITGSSGTVIKSFFSEIENKIQNISSDSDMNMNLQVGKNQFRLLRSDGDFRCQIKYRQKYIGV